jgi:hypothetical protein
MGNNWTDHVRREATRLNISYMCAASKPEVKASYKRLDRPQRAGNRPHRDEVVSGPANRPTPTPAPTPVRPPVSNITSESFFKQRKERLKKNELERRRLRQLPENKKVIDELTKFFEEGGTYKKSTVFKNKSSLLNVYNKIKLILEPNLKSKLQQKLKV